jgi:hypothetical protein
LFFIFVGALTAFGSVHAQDGGDVSLAAQAGFDGYCKERSWIPVRVTMENTGSDLNVRVQVVFRNSNLGNRSVNAADLSLPASSRKEIVLYIYPQGFLSTLNISLLADGRELTKTELKVNCLTRENLLFGLLADNPSAFLPLNDIQTANGVLRVAQLEISDLPDRAQGWEALDALVISGVDTGTLTSEQQSALSSWLAEGGKLLVIGGPKWQASVSGVIGFMPIDLNMTRTVQDLSELKAYIDSSIPLEGMSVLTVGQLHSGAEVLVEQDGFPLLTQTAIGFGKVIYLAADPALEPLSNWEGMKDVYGKLLGSRSLRPVWLNSQWDVFNANSALSTLNELGIPSIGFICCWLVVYVATIGPVNFLVLNRMKKRELAWLTIPAMVVFFSGLAYFSGFMYRGTRPIINRLAVIQAWDKMEQARVKALAGLYSPTRTKYTIDSGTQFMLYPFEGMNTNLQSNNSWFALQHGPGMSVPDVLVEIGGVEAASAQGYLPALGIEHDLVINVSDKTPTLKGNITNASQYMLKDAILVTPGDWKRLGDLAPGSTHNANVTLIPGPNGPEFYNLNASTILGVDYYGGPASREDRRRVALMDAAMASNYGTKEANWGIYLMGWVVEPLTPISLQDKDFESIDTTLYIHMLSPDSHIESGPLRLTPTMFIWETSSPGSTPYYSHGIPVGGYILRFRSAIPVQFSSVNSLKLDINSSGTPSEVFVSLWDFEQDTWIQMSGLFWGDNDIPEPWRYVGKNGEIRLKVDGNQSNYIEMYSSHFTLVVER